MTRIAGLLEWLTNILTLHFWWVLYLLRGAVVLGVFPATAAVFAVIRYWLRKEDDEAVSVLFKRYYRENFRTANILGWALAIISLIIVVNWLFLPYYTNPVLKTVMYAIVILFSFFVIVIWLYLFPVLVHYDLPLQNYLFIIFKTAAASFLSIIMQLLLIGIYVGIVYYLPPVAVLFGITFAAVAQMAISHNIFRQFDQQKEQ
ncbi:Uncharacterized membrane protein YesL [Evansella caseinilytica]|uniref:Uncharacterized membrane protein YesL n=1 Tax=Evansella caseinilytica TaxID=1503961 RepID=A0A1H3QE12_9BACI|nr:DUF624 domain-containing protein [Evansella caseinilytica]SDZ11530.1 Uncharacterized membrane protein YesL [Evansella caseinilytica]